MTDNDVRQVWKFELSLGKNEIKMPEGALVLTAQIQSKRTQDSIVDTICLWAEVYPDIDSREIRKFAVVGTGHDYSPGSDYFHVGTVQDSAGFVWHVFEDESHE